VVVQRQLSANMSYRSRSTSRRELPVLRSRSLSPNLPYLYPDSANEGVENKYRKGWYRVDYGGTQDPQMWYLPRFSDRLKFLENRVDRTTARSSSVPPEAETVKTIVKYTKPSTTTTTVPSYYYRSLYYPYRGTSDLYSPFIGPYSGRLYTSSYRWPYSYLDSYDSSLETKLVLDRAERALNRSAWIPTYYRGYNRYLPSSYYDYDYYYPSLRTSSYLDDDYYGYRPRAIDYDFRSKSVVPRTTYTYSYARPITTTRSYYLY